MKIMIGNFFAGLGLLQLPKYHKVCSMIVMNFYSSEFSTPHRNQPATAYNRTSSYVED